MTNNVVMAPQEQVNWQQKINRISALLDLMLAGEDALYRTEETEFNVLTGLVFPLFATKGQLATYMQGDFYAKYQSKVCKNKTDVAIKIHEYYDEMVKHYQLQYDSNSKEYQELQNLIGGLNSERINGLPLKIILREGLLNQYRRFVALRNRMTEVGSNIKGVIVNKAKAMNHQNTIPRANNFLERISRSAQDRFNFDRRSRGILSNIQVTKICQTIEHELNQLSKPRPELTHESKVFQPPIL